MPATPRHRPGLLLATAGKRYCPGKQLTQRQCLLHMDATDTRLKHENTAWHDSYALAPWERPTMMIERAGHVSSQVKMTISVKSDKFRHFEKCVPS